MSQKQMSSWLGIVQTEKRRSFTEMTGNRMPLFCMQTTIGVHPSTCHAGHHASLVGVKAWGEQVVEAAVADEARGHEDRETDETPPNLQRDTGHPTGLRQSTGPLRTAWNTSDITTPGPQRDSKPTGSAL